MGLQFYYAFSLVAVLDNTFSILLFSLVAILENKFSIYVPLRRVRIVSSCSVCERDRVKVREGERERGREREREGEREGKRPCGLSY